MAGPSQHDRCVRSQSVILHYRAHRDVQGPGHILEPSSPWRRMRHQAFLGHLCHPGTRLRPQSPQAQDPLEGPLWFSSPTVLALLLHRHLYQEPLLNPQSDLVPLLDTPLYATRLLHEPL